MRRIGRWLLAALAVAALGTPAARAQRPVPAAPNGRVLPIRHAAPDDVAILDALAATTYDDGRTILTIRPASADQPGFGSSERLLLGDVCGVSGVPVRIQDGTLSVVPGNGVLAACPRSPVRTVLLANPTIAVDKGKVIFVAGRSRVSLPAAPGPRTVPALLRSYRGPNGSSSAATSVTAREGEWWGSDGCNETWTQVAFSARRFMFDPMRSSTMMLCTNYTPTALKGLFENRSRIGTHRRSGRTLTLTFRDGGVATVILAA